MMGGEGACAVLAPLIRRTERGWQANQVAREIVERLQQEWVRAFWEEEFTELLHHVLRPALLLDESPGASERMSTTPSPTSKRNSIQNL